MSDYKKYGITELKITKSDRKDKQRKATFKYKGERRVVHYGDPDMKEFPGTKRGDNYCARSYGLAKQYNILSNPLSPNFWSRKDLWNCRGKKSKR
jgi:hypothetical protein